MSAVGKSDAVGWPTVALVAVVGGVVLAAPGVVVRTLRAPSTPPCAEKVIDGWQDTDCEPGQTVEVAKTGDAQRLICRCPMPVATVKP